MGRKGKASIRGGYGDARTHRSLMRDNCSEDGRPAWEIMEEAAADRSAGAPLLPPRISRSARLIRPGGLAIRSSDPHICSYPDQLSRLVGMRGDFQRKGSACSISSIVQKQPSSASWSRFRPAPRKAVNFKIWNDASLR